MRFPQSNRASECLPTVRLLTRSYLIYKAAFRSTIFSMKNNTIRTATFFTAVQPETRDAYSRYVGPPYSACLSACLSFWSLHRTSTNKQTEDRTWLPSQPIHHYTLCQSQHRLFSQVRTANYFTILFPPYSHQSQAQSPASLSHLFPHSSYTFVTTHPIMCLARQLNPTPCPSSATLL